MFSASFLLLTLLWSQISAYNYLVISTNFVYSHTVFNAKIAEVLQDRGHHVNFILFRTNNYTKFNPGPLRNVTVITADSIDLMTETASKLKLFNDVFSDNEPLFGDDQVRPIFEAMKIYCKDLLYNEQVKKIAEEIKYDGIFTESHDVCGQSMTHIYNIKPLFLMSPVPIPEHSAIEMGIPFNPNVVPVLNRAPPNGVYMTLLERIQNWREYYDSTVKMSKWFANPEVYELTNLQLPHPAEFTKNAAFYIQNTNEFVDLPRPISLKQLFVGGVGITKAKALSEEIHQIYSSAKKGVVFFSFGSLADNKKLPQNVRTAFAEAFSQFPDYQFIWKFNDKLNESSIGNVHTLQWVDQVSILKHPKTKAFITHCGLNSLNEAAFAGVPLISVPLFGDQTYNTAIVKHIGNGVHLNKLKLTSKIIVKALNSVLNEEKYGKNARELSELLNNLPQSPEERLINAVEQATRFPEAYEKLILPGAKISFWAYFGLDIVGLLISLIVFSGFVVYLLFRVMVRIYLTVEKKNRKKLE